ncbi:MAG: carbon starvation protein A, partial [Muribaculaceae bacterium]|nr:carbon starvation protein A [Muribaculaceae bacterium]
SWLGTFGGILAVLGVIAAPITSGDTALRSARLIAADFMGIKQGRIIKRLMVSLPIFALCFAVMLLPYESLWRYFAWSNQMLAVFTLWALTVYLARNRKLFLITLIPALFMTAVTMTYIFFAPEGFGALTDALWGVKISYEFALGVGLGITAICLFLFARYLKSVNNSNIIVDNPA